jgi:hypothetical protein
LSKYDNYWQERKPIKKKGPHPIWMGIGFLLLLIIPTMSWAASLILIEQDLKYGWYRLTPDMIAPGADPLLYAKIFLTIIISSVFFVLLYVIYFIVYRFIGPKRYGSLDVPMGNYKVKRYKR